LLPDYDYDGDTVLLTIPLTFHNVLGLVTIGTLALIGTCYVWVLYNRKKCTCRLCRQEVRLGKCIGEGGFGAVYLAYIKTAE